MDRRRFLQLGVGAAVCGGTAIWRRNASSPQCVSWPAPAYSVIPVVADGKWIWNKPPQGQTGYLEPRSYLLDVGIEMTAQGNGTQIRATTPAPVSCPEQKIEQETIETRGCQAELRDLGPDARQLSVSAPQIAAGQTISAVAHCKVTISKQYFNYQREQFPQEQNVPADVRRTYLGDSPGIETRVKEVRQLLGELAGDLKHPWDLAEKFAAWIPRNIKAQIAPFSSVAATLQSRLGDCEHMSAVYVALCRAAGIPARLVWVPNHNWSEIYLSDKEGKGHWLPVHTACYFWFGWTGAHELVLQKGDRLRVPGRGSRFFRLQEDWLQWGGRKPAVRYLAKLVPQPPTPDSDAGPGAREKIESGEWKLLGTHPLDRYARR
jgi:hypothetical protein